MAAATPRDHAVGTGGSSSVTTGAVFRLWLPLAASWALMGAEGPSVTAFVARLPEEQIHLAAFGGIAFAISLVIEGPIIMMLAASTALCGDWDSYRKVRRFTFFAAAALTAAHVAVAFTPLYDFVARVLLAAPEDIVEPGRLGLRLLTPWTAMIAYRRFQQGVLIRFDRTRAVMWGTVLRLFVLLGMLAAGTAHGGLPGIAVGTLAISCAVTAEAVFVGCVVQPVLRERLRPGPPEDGPLTRRAFLAFYLPLAVTPMLTLCIQPAGAAAMSRMPVAEMSLAAWQVVHALVFLTRSTGFAFNEVVVSLIGRPGGYGALRRFAWMLALTMMGVLALLALTPLSTVWFRTISGIEPELMEVCRTALLFALLMPGYQVFQSWFQGRLVHARRTRGITEAVALYVIVALTGLGVGVAAGAWTGIYAALAAFTVGGVLQTAWLARRASALTTTHGSDRRASAAARRSSSPR